MYDPGSGGKSKFLQRAQDKIQPPHFEGQEAGKSHKGIRTGAGQE